MYFVGGLLAFLVSHIAVIIGLVIPPASGQGSIISIVKARPYMSWAVVLPFWLLLTVLFILFAVVYGGVPVIFTAVYVGSELIEAWALLVRYRFYNYEVLILCDSLVTNLGSLATIGL